VKSERASQQSEEKRSCFYGFRESSVGSEFRREKTWISKSKLS